MPPPTTLAIPPNGAGFWACVDGSCPGFVDQEQATGLTAYQLAVLRHAVGDIPGALQLLQQGPGEPDALRLQLLLLLQQGEAEGLQELLLKSGLTGPEQPITAVQIAVYLQHAAFFAAHYSKLLSGTPGQVLALPESASSWPPELQLLANAYVDSINVAVRGKPEALPYAHHLVPDAQTRRFVSALSNRGENTTDLWSQLAQATPDRPLPSLNAGVAHLQHGQLVSAVAHLEAAAAMAPGEPLSVVYQYVAYLLQEDFQGANLLLAQKSALLPLRWNDWLASLSPDEKRGRDAGRGKIP